jgi:hypothetical protein
MQSAAMRSRNELTIRGTAPQIAQLLKRLEQPQAKGWRRHAEAESRRHALGMPDMARCFACTAESRRPAAALWLQLGGEDRLFVEDIVALGKGGLTDDEYNLILAEFESEVLGPAGAGLDIQTSVSANRITLEAYLSREAVRRLQAFSSTANKASLHLADCRPWREFIIQSHLESADFDPLLLEQWLAEQGWSEEQRQHLVGEYESSRSILAAYDEERLERCLP